ncbi:MAG: hypothetical protein IPK28_07900 [Devosia sp.]|nr:hypothetical protein [Devosia sp.]
MRRLIAILVFSLASGVGAAAFDDPMSLLDAIYRPYTTGAKHEGLEQFYSTRLKDLYAANLEQQSTDSAGTPVDPNAPDMLTFDPFIEGQNSLLLDLAIGSPVMLGERALATVTFHNFDHASMLSIAMLREADGWKVDDIASMGSSENWLLSWLLQYDPFGVN